MQTPRLCIDGRAANDFSPQGWIAQELIDQLVTAQGEPESNRIVDSKRAVLLSHPHQSFAGQLKRFNTNKRIGSSFLYWAWEKNFVESSGIGAFHRFRPVDRLEPQHTVATLTTVLPALGRFTFSRPPKGKNIFVVPSQKDAERLHVNYRIPVDRIHVIAPTLRRYVQFTEHFEPMREGWILIVVDRSRDEEVRRLETVLESRFPRLKKKILTPKEAKQLSPSDWIQNLKNTSMLFYLNEKPFDWPFLYLESIYLRIPAIFVRKNSALSEMISGSSLELSRYLTELYSPEQLLVETELVFEGLKQRGTFEPLGMARAYRQVYNQFTDDLKIEASEIEATPSCCPN